MGVTGEVQREGEVVHLIAHKLEDRTALLGGLRTVRGISVSPKVPSANGTGSFIRATPTALAIESLSENSVG